MVVQTLRQTNTGIRNGAWHDHYGNACNEARSFLGSPNKLGCGDLSVADRTAGWE